MEKVYCQETANKANVFPLWWYKSDETLYKTPDKKQRFKYRESLHDIVGVDCAVEQLHFGGGVNELVTENITDIKKIIINNKLTN